MRRVFQAALLAVSCATPSWADELKCDPAGTQRQMNYCAQLAFEAADGDLNADYAAAIEHMRAQDAYAPENLRGAQASLREAQRAWILYRDAACEAEGFPHRGGSIEPLIVLSCKERLSRMRSEDLRRIFEVN